MLSSRKVGLALVRTQDLGAQHGLVEVELAVELLDGGGLGLEVDDGVDALGLLRDLERHPATAPDVDLLDAAAVVLHDGQELVEGRSDGALLDVGVEDDHELVVTHAGNPPPLDYGGHGLSVAGGLLRLSAAPPGYPPDGPPQNRRPQGPCQACRSVRPGRRVKDMTTAPRLRIGAHVGSDDSLAEAAAR